jgi:TonB family protein
LAAEEAARKKMQREQTPQPPTPQPPSPTPPPPVAKNEPLLPMPNVRPQSSLPDMPSPNAPSQNNQSAKDTGDDQFNNQIRAAARAAMKGNKGGMTYGQGGAGGGKNRGLAAGMGIISDTQGVNFDAWLQRLQYIIQHSWEPQIPESARPPLNKQGVTGIRFTIDKDGTLEGNMVLETPSGDVALDKAAWSAITGPQPFPPLPKEFHGKNIIIRGGFFYNIPPE